MKLKTIILSLAFAAIVYLVLFTYVFGVSPYIKQESMATWLVIEGSKEQKYSDTKICLECHYDTYKGMKNHSSVNCEACHGSGKEHTLRRSEESIKIERSRNACLKCHLDIPGRSVIDTVNESHNQGILCVVCHNPHE